jgi:hypothetical protein
MSWSSTIRRFVNQLCDNVDNISRLPLRTFHRRVEAIFIAVGASPTILKNSNKNYFSLYLNPTCHKTLHLGWMLYDYKNLESCPRL